MNLKVAVIGAGGFGRHHIRILAGMEGVDLVGAVDPDPSRAKDHTDPYDVPLLSSIDDLPDDLDAAVVAVPTERHFEVAGVLLDRGVGVLVEKPLARDVASAEAIVAAAETSGAVLAVGHVERFNPAVTAAMGRITDPRFIECRRVAPFSFRSSDIGVVLDLMIHDLDICLALVASPVKAVDACGTPVLGEHEDIANARIEFESGCVADVTASRIAMKTERKIRMFCPDAYLSLDFAKQSGVLYRKSPKLTPEYVQEIASGASTITDLKGLVFGKLLTIEHLSMESHDPLTEELLDFLSAVRNGSSPTVSGRDGLRAVDAAVQVLAAIGQSPVLR